MDRYIGTNGVYLVLMADYMYLHCHSDCGRSYQLDYSTGSNCQIPGINIVLWGTVLALHSVCANFTVLVTVRTLLGIFEAACQPSFIVLSSMWYKREEQMARVAYWYMMNVSIFIPIHATLLTYICIPRVRSKS